MEGVTRLGQRLQENLSEAARDFGLPNGIDSLIGPSTGAGKYLEQGALTSEDSAKETRKLLSSLRDRDKEEGLRRVLALMIKNKPVAAYFPLVSNCLSSSSVIVRSLVSVYILRQAQLEPDLALLVVNMYQKDLNDPNPAVRASALRVLIGMELEAISSMVVMSLVRSARDSNWYVRKIVAHSLVKLYNMDAGHLGSILTILNSLLQDRSALVIGAAVSAFNDICPDHLTIIHPAYRRLCRSLLDADEWGQLAMVHLLERYARSNLPAPVEPSQDLDRDLDLLIGCCEPLMQSRNPAVCMAVIRLLHNVGPSTSRRKMVKPVLRLLHSSEEMMPVILADVEALCKTYPDLFGPHYRDFLIRSSDSLQTKKLRLRCLINLVTAERVDHLLAEFQLYMQDPDEQFAAHAVEAFGACALRHDELAVPCLTALLRFLQTAKQHTRSQAVQVIQSLIVHLPHGAFQANLNPPQIISQLVAALHADQIQDTAARASIYWLVGRHSQDLLDTFGPDVVRKAAQSFAQEDRPAKLEIISLSSKFLIAAYEGSGSSRIRILGLLFDYITTLARYDLDYGVRDRARYTKGVLTAANIGTNIQQAQVVDIESFQRGETAESVEEPKQSEPTLSLQQAKQLLMRADHVYAPFMLHESGSSFGTLSSIMNKPITVSARLPPWTNEPSASSLRDENVEVDTANAAATLSASSSRLSSSKGFGNSGPSQRGSRSPEQLVPRQMSPSMAAPVVRRNLDDFLKEESEEDESSAEESSEESEEESSEDEADDQAPLRSR